VPASDEAAGFCSSGVVTMTSAPSFKRAKPVVTTVSAAPNFAFDLCVHKIPDEDIRGLDLRSWRLVMNGSEAVSPDTIDRFFGGRPMVSRPAPCARYTAERHRAHDVTDRSSARGRWCANRSSSGASAFDGTGPLPCDSSAAVLPEHQYASRRVGTAVANGPKAMRLAGHR
jgi:hypothetical protein